MNNYSTSKYYKLNEKHNNGQRIALQLILGVFFGIIIADCLIKLVR